MSNVVMMPSSWMRKMENGIAMTRWKKWKKMAAGFHLISVAFSPFFNSRFGNNVALIFFFFFFFVFSCCCCCCFGSHLPFRSWRFPCFSLFPPSLGSSPPPPPPWPGCHLLWLLPLLSLPPPPPPPPPSEIIPNIIANSNESGHN